MAKNTNLVTLPNGKRAFLLDDNVDAALIITYGDTDGDGAKGSRALAFADIPFDGSDLPDPVYDSKESEKIDMRELPDRLRGLVMWFSNLLRFVK